MTCTHSSQRERWVDDVYDDWSDRYVGGHWEYYTESHCVDIDLHRWKCTRCGHIDYYSGRARDHFEGRTKDSFIVETNERYKNGNQR